MFRKGNVILGAIFIVFGGLFLLNNLNLVSFEWMDIGYIFATFWPLFVIIPGIIMHQSYFAGDTRDAGILVPGGILLTIGVVFQLSMLFDIWHLLWPGFILAPAVGLFELYYFGTREKALLIPVGILGGLSIIFFGTFSLSQLFKYSIFKLVVPLVLIGIGIVILAGNSDRYKKF